MEFTESQIARLVLGYLKDEKCNSVVTEFLKTSKHLKQGEKALKNKFYTTRVAGLNLLDILQEYSTIYTIVQGRLEATSYYNESHPRISLVEQLLYLLNKIQYSRTSTPCSSPTYYRSPEPSPSQHVSSETSISHSGVETTPVHTLPGNLGSVSEKSYLSKSSMKKTSKANKSAPLDKYICSPNEEISEVLTQTLLENTELHEKLAEAINNVRNTPEVVPKKKVTEDTVKVGAVAELDATIKTVVRRTEADPIFDKILDELIACTQIELQNPEDNPSVNSCNIVEEQNNDDIHSIGASTLKSHPVEMSVGPNNSEVIVFEGSLDNYIKTSNSSVQQTQVVLNDGDLLMIHPKQYHHNQQPDGISNSGTITREDILAMPTVIVNDDVKKVVDTSSKPTTAKPVRRINRTSKKSKILTRSMTLPKIAPKICMELAMAKNKTDFLTVFSNKYDNSALQSPFGFNSILPLTTTTVVIQNPLEQSTSSSLQKDLLPSNVNCEDTTDSKAGKSSNLTPATKDSNHKTTPKSGSHVRNLDFSTPPKITSSVKKVKKPTENVRKDEATRALFKLDKLTNTKSWDTEMRILASNPSEETKVAKPATSTKRRRISPKPKNLSKPTSRKKPRIEDANTTEQDALLLEAALLSPLNKSRDKAKFAKQEELKTEKTDQPTPERKKNLQDSRRKTRSSNKNLKEDPSEDIASKLILSPSKLNAKKRNLVKTDEQKPSCVVVQLPEPDKDENQLITPELCKLNFPQPINAKRNITPLLETPIKTDVLPKTPGIETPGMDSLNISNFTPFNKVLEEHLKGIDLNAINTPNLPITPRFPTTAELISPYSNRPTDYSTGGSSYYQPSDTEQNKSLEQMVIEECKRLEECREKISNAKVKILSNVVLEPCKSDDIDKEFQNKNENTHVTIFNQNIIGKKNLNLIKSPSSSVSSSSSSSSSNSSDSEEDTKTNDTVICKKTEEPTGRTYPLRNRTTRQSFDECNKGPTADGCVEISNILSTVEVTNTLTKNKPASPIISQQEKVLMEMEEKRKRTISKFKNKISSSSEKLKNTSVRLASSRAAKKSPKVYATPRKTVMKNRRKSLTPRKALPENIAQTSDEDLAIKLISEKGKSKNKTTALQKKIDIPKSASDVEAENLIHGLKERGIHLMHNKTPKKPSPQTQKSMKKDIETVSLPDEPTMMKKCEKATIVSNDDEQQIVKVFDTKLIAHTDYFVSFEESKKITKKFADYDTSVLNKVLSAKIYVEKLNTDVDIPISCSPFLNFIDIPTKLNVLIPKRSKRDSSKTKNKSSETVVKKSDTPIIALDVENHVAHSLEELVDDDLMNYAVVGSVREENDQNPMSPKSTKKRKNSCERELQGDKKSKKDCDDILKNLKRIDVDTFLNKLHGQDYKNM